jgi:hypothetical protein
MLKDQTLLCGEHQSAGYLLALDAGFHSQQ